MSCNIELSSITADLMLPQCNRNHGQSNYVFHKKVQPDSEERFKTVDLSKEYCSSELLKDVSKTENEPSELLSWEAIPDSKHPNYESKPEAKLEVTSTQYFQEDLILFEEEKLIDINKEHWEARKRDNMSEAKPKYYDDLKTIFVPSLINMETDSNINCQDIITLGRVNQLKMYSETASPESIINIDKEPVTLGRVNILKPLKGKTDSIIDSNRIRKNVDLVDLFEDLTVTPKDFSISSIKTKSNVLTSALLTLKTNQQDHNTPIPITDTGCSKDKFCSKKVFDQVNTNIKSNNKILAIKDDKILEVMGNNVIINCDRTYVISAQPQAACSKCIHDDKRKPIHNEAIQVDKPDTSEDISRHTVTMPATVKKQPSVDYVNTSLLLNNCERKPSPLNSQDHIDTEKRIKTLCMKSDRDNATSCNEKLMQGLNSTRLLPKFEPEVIEENHAMTRIRWQKERKAIDEFINRGKVIK